MKPVFIKTLSKSLKKELPGLNAHQQMMIYPNRFSMKNKKIGIPASVLLLLYPQKNDWFFFLTKRSKDVEHHKGQISLPGGGVEKNESKSDAAASLLDSFFSTPPPGRDICPLWCSTSLLRFVRKKNQSFFWGYNKSNTDAGIPIFLFFIEKRFG